MEPRLDPNERYQVSPKRYVALSEDASQRMTAAKKTTESAGLFNAERSAKRFEFLRKLLWLEYIEYMLVYNST